MLIIPTRIDCIQFYTFLENSNYSSLRKLITPTSIGLFLWTPTDIFYIYITYFKDINHI